MSIASTQLPTALQTLIDSRLDTIDRMLLGRVPRQDRVAIVREVESQIFELLHEQGSDEPSREDVLAALARLDPPEAYLPDDEDVHEGPSPQRRSTLIAGTGSPGRARISKGARAAGILGIVSLSLLVLSPLFYLFADLLGALSVGLAYVFLFGMLGLMFVGAVLSITLGALNRRSGAWPMVGIVTGIVTALGALFLGCLLMMIVQGV